MQVFSLKSAEIEAQVVPEFGARVVALVDRRTGRDWLVGGDLEGDVDDAASFLGNEARGWDECFPTVAPCYSLDWGRSLRDHGDLWGRSWTVDAASNDHLSCTYAAEGYTFTRNMTLAGETLRNEYAVMGPARPFLYSQHMLLATEPGEQIILNGIGTLSYGEYQLPWPANNNRIGAMSAAIASKTYAAANGQVSAAVSGPTGSITLSWNAEDMPFFGMWRCFGGWPDAQNPVHQLALEPTTAPADDLAQAVLMGYGPTLSPDMPVKWVIDVSLSAAPTPKNTAMEAHQ